MYNNANQVGPAAPQTIIIQPGVIGSQAVGTGPSTVTCPRCNTQIVTRVSYQAGTGTWLLCLGLFLIGCDLGCCLIPFCVDGAKNANHFCPNCGTPIGQKNFCC